MHAILLKKNTISKKEKRAMINFLLCQAIVALALVILSVFFLGKGAAKSVFFGALVTLVPNIVLAFFMFMRATKRSAKQVVKACYVGEVIKILLIAGMMLFILHSFAVQMGPFFLGFLGTYLVYVFSPVILKKSCC